MATLERRRGDARVLRIGERTQGVFSDVLPRVLPNFFVLQPPNEAYLDTGGRDYEIHGIAPDVVVPVFHPDDGAAGADPGLRRAR